MNDFAKAIAWLLKPFIAVVALILVFEEWLWDVLKAQLHRLSHWAVVRSMERWFSALPPWASLLVMVIPAAALLPFKIAGLWALAHGHALLGLLVFVLAKIAGTALAAYLFDLVRNQARQLHWFNRLYLFIQQLLQAAHAWLAAQPVYVQVRDRVRAARMQWSARWSRERRRPVWLRRVQLAKARVRRWFS